MGNGDGDPVGVPYIDILFSFAIGEIFLAAAGAERFSSIAVAGYSHLGLALILISLSWVGYHQARANGVPYVRYYNREFFQLGVDIAIVASYFVFVLTAEGVPGLGGKHGRDASALPEAYIILLDFALYLLWDFFEVWIKRSNDKCHHFTAAERREAILHRRATMIFLLFFLLFFVLIAVEIQSTNPTTTKAIVVADAFLAFALLAYRGFGRLLVEYG